MSNIVMPIPKNPVVRQVPSHPDRFEFFFAGLDRTEYEILFGFFNKMSGRLGVFKVNFPPLDLVECRFDSDTADFTTFDNKRWEGSLTIRVLRQG